MDREEKRRRFQELVLKKLYPSSDEHPNPSKHDDQIHLQMTDYEYEIEETVYLNLVNQGLDDIDESEPEEKASSDDRDSVSQKQLTRAQRKRLRKKKLKETASRPRNKIIGPLLPSTSQGNNDSDVREEEGALSENAALDDAIVKPASGEKRCSNTQKKLKHRRSAKRLNLSNNVETYNPAQDRPLTGQWKYHQGENCSHFRGKALTRKKHSSIS